MTGKIFRSTLAASLTVLLASLLVITGCLYTYFGTVREQQLQTELTLAAAAVEADGADYLVRVRDTAERLTWVASDGTVLYDTRADTQPMENHGQREEIREALTGGSGSSARYSETLTEKMLYQAVRLTDGSVLRISGSQKTVWMLVLGMLHAVIVVALLAVGLSALLASRAARRVVEPLNRLDLEHPKDLTGAPSLVLRCMGKQESAWDLAKQYNTTIPAILAANELEDGGRSGAAGPQRAHPQHQSGGPNTVSCGRYLRRTGFPDSGSPSGPDRRHP